MEKELFAVVSAIGKFKPDLVGAKVIAYTDHATLRYHLAKKVVMPWLIRWIFAPSRVCLANQEEEEEGKQISGKSSLKDTSSILRDDTLSRVIISGPWYKNLALERR